MWRKRKEMRWALKGFGYCPEMMNGSTKLNSLGIRTNESEWRRKYSARHKLERIQDLPAGLALPKRVRLYSRHEHYVLQWWSKPEKCTLTERVDGDLLAALIRARAIDAQLETQPRLAGGGSRKLTHFNLIDRFLQHLELRANAGQLAVRTIERYRSALAHYRRFTSQPAAQRLARYASQVSGEYRLALEVFLKDVRVAANGHPNGQRRALAGRVFVVATVRAMYRWAASEAANYLLPAHFANPFADQPGSRQGVARDPFGEPDVTLEMAAEFLSACDMFQLQLFAPLMLYGLRAAEPAFVFHEHCDADWVKVICIPELSYWTKGRRDKRFPVLPVIARLLSLEPGQDQGLLYVRRGAGEASKRTPYYGLALDRLVAAFRERQARLSHASATEINSLRDELHRQAGGINYDQIEHEFLALRRALGWPKAATLKDFRHLFSTALENAGVPEFYRRYFMGQSPGRSAIVTYTHLNQLREKYLLAANTELRPLVEAAERRLAELEQPASSAATTLARQAS